jgi:hypothetical protein
MLPSIRDEVTCIVDAYRHAPRGGDVHPPRRGADIGVVAANGGVSYLYAVNHLLVADAHLDDVLEILGGPPRRWLDPGESDEPPERKRSDDEPAASEPERDEVGLRRVIAGVTQLVLPTGRRGERTGEWQGRFVPDWLDLIDQQLGRGAATPDHVLTVAPATACCPATEPEPAYAGTEPWPPVCPPGGGAGTLVYVADTGLLADAARGHPWLAGVVPGDPGHDVDPLTQPITSEYTGHGTFVAGVARCLAPAAEVTVTNAFAIAGSTLESCLVPHLEAALAGGVDIFHLSIAAPTRHDLALLGFGAWLRLLRQYKGTVCVVAAGNSGSRRPTWPAAFPEVVSVGALTADGHSRADFSNFGGWVDVYAPGRDIVNAYPTGTYQCQIDPYAGQERQFHGMARWSGTSFSTPIVTGLIAARMSATGESARQAADALLAQARRDAIPGVGAILRPRCDHRGGGRCPHPEPCAARGGPCAG